MERISVELAERSYPIHIGSGILNTPDQLISLLQPHIRGRQVAIFTNVVVAELYVEKLLAALGDYQVDVFSMPDGEPHKNLDTYAAAMDFLMRERHNRSTCLIALGGGVVGDLTGFVAATFQRGVDFIQIPTTLLAQVDSSVGGKTAVNHSAGKNMIGAFYQPKCVLIDTDVLHSLPSREYAAGMAEVVKYGVIADASFFTWLEQNTSQVLSKHAQSLAHLIARSCEIKAQIVSQDERESGVRAILNFGHTFGHAIESLAGYGTWLHGEAVAIGMVMAAGLSERRRLLAQGGQQRISELLESFGLPTQLQPRLPVDDMIHAMGMDKKVTDGRLRFILAQQIGQAMIDDEVDQQTLAQVLTESINP